MPYVTVGKENTGNVDPYYEDHGSDIHRNFISVSRRFALHAERSNYGAWKTTPRPPNALPGSACIA
jgi:hypothetical protein